MHSSQEAGEEKMGPPPDGCTAVTDDHGWPPWVRQGHCEKTLQSSYLDTHFQGTLWILTPTLVPKFPRPELCSPG